MWVIIKEVGVTGVAAIRGVKMTFAWIIIYPDPCLQLTVLSVHTLYNSLSHCHKHFPRLWLHISEVELPIICNTLNGSMLYSWYCGWVWEELMQRMKGLGASFPCHCNLNPLSNQWCCTAADSTYSWHCTSCLDQPPLCVLQQSAVCDTLH